MRDAAPTTIYLKDYAPFGYAIEHVELTFDLSPNATRVKSRIAFRPNASKPAFIIQRLDAEPPQQPSKLESDRRE